MTLPARLSRRYWVGPALLAIGVAAAAVSHLDGRTPGHFELGALYTLTQMEQALPLVGTGIVLAEMPGRASAVGVGLLLIGVLAGGIVADIIGAMIAANAGVAGFVLLIGPVCAIIVGVALAAPRRFAAWLAPSAAFVTGTALGMVIDFSATTPHAWSFAAGEVLAGLWLALTLLFLWRSFATGRLSIAARIFGSWLVAIGIMLAAAKLIPPSGAF